MNFDTPQAAGALVLGALVVLILMRRFFAGVTVQLGG